MTFITTQVISATKFTLIGPYSVLSSWRTSPVAEALIPTARRQQLLLLALSFELVLKETTGPTGGTQKESVGWPH